MLILSPTFESLEAPCRHGAARVWASGARAWGTGHSYGWTGEPAVRGHNALPGPACRRTYSRGRNCYKLRQSIELAHLINQLSQCNHQWSFHQVGRGRRVAPRAGPRHGVAAWL